MSSEMSNEAHTQDGGRRIGAIVQARMSSRRLPGKSLRPLRGKPMLQYVLESLMHVGQLDETIVATSTDPSDDRITELCDRMGLACFRGSLENVAERFLLASKSRGFSAFIRVSGDSPLLDGRLVVRAIDLFVESNADVVTNVFPRTYPPGLSVELVRTASFERAIPKFDDPYDREHVTSYFYRNADQFRIVNFSLNPPRCDVHLAVDTHEQFEYADRIVAMMNRPHWEYSLDELLAICDELPAPGGRPASKVQP
jgi:spore coat polysaccharide biosynthesis protein SpsF (cytidylyltransferase family)